MSWQVLNGKMVMERLEVEEAAMLRLYPQHAFAVKKVFYRLKFMVKDGELDDKFVMDHMDHAEGFGDDG